MTPLPSLPRTLLLALALVAATAGADESTEVSVDQLGQPAVPEQAGRTIVITPDTRVVAVVEGEIVRFVVEGRAFAFDFDRFTVRSFALNRVAPSGLLKQTVLVTVARNAGATRR